MTSTTARTRAVAVVMGVAGAAAGLGAGAASAAPAPSGSATSSHVAAPHDVHRSGGDDDGNSSGRGSGGDDDGDSSGSGSGGDDDRVELRGSCSGRGTWKLKVRSDDGRLEVEGEVDSSTAGQRWRWTMRHNGSVSDRGTGWTSGSSGSFEVERRMVDLAGTDTITFRAARRGRVCRGVVNY